MSAPVYSHIAYIDESGDEGFVSRSSKWFVLSAVVLRTEIEKASVSLVDNVRSLLGKPAREPLHFRNLKHDQAHRPGEAAQTDFTPATELGVTIAGHWA